MGYKNILPAEPVVLREVIARKIIARMGTTASLAITWVQAEAGFGKSFIAQYLSKKAAQAFSYKVAEVHFYPQPDTAINKLQHEILKTILPSNKTEWLKVIESNNFFHSLGDSAFVFTCLSDILHLESESVASYIQLDKASKAKVKRRIVCEFINEFLQKNKLLLFLEDLHWLSRDEATEINSILHECRNNSGFHIICTSRQNFVLDNNLKANTEIFKLPPLTHAQSLALLKAGSPSLSEKIFPKLVKLSAGNPFFVKEYARWAQDESKKGKSFDEILEKANEYTPQEISKIIYSKLSNCDELAISIVKAASIQGIRVDIETLATVMGLPKEQVTSTLDILVSEKIFKLNKNTLDEEYEFSHELIQRVIYDCIAEKDKASLHERVIQYLRFSKRTRYECTARLMSYHASRTGNGVLAYIYAKRAARETNRLSQHKAAREYLENAEKALEKMRGSFKRERHIARLRLEEIDSLFIMGDYAAVKTSIEYLLEKKSTLSLSMLRQVLSFQGLFFWINGKIPQAKKVYESILTADSGDLKEETALREGMRLANICIDLAKYAESLKYSDSVIGLLNEDNVHLKYGLLGEVGPAIYSCKALAQAKLGNKAEALLSIKRAQQLVSESEDYFTRIYTSVFLAHALLTLESYEDVKGILKTTLVYCNTVQSDLLKPYALSVYGLASAKLGDIRAGEKFCAEAIDLAQKSNLLLRRALFSTWYAEVLILGGKHSAAIEYLDFAIEHAKASGETSRLKKAYVLLEECQRTTSAKKRIESKKRPNSFHKDKKNYVGNISILGVNQSGLRRRKAG